LSKLITTGRAGTAAACAQASQIWSSVTAVQPAATQPRVGVDSPAPPTSARLATGRELFEVDHRRSCVSNNSARPERRPTIPFATHPSAAAPAAGATAPSRANRASP
jgi:hypothetical protein